MERPIAGVDAGDHTGQQLLGLAHELIIDHIPFRFPNALDDDLTGGLGGDAAEVFGFDLTAHHVTQLHVGQGTTGFLQGNLGVRIVHFLHHVPTDDDADGVLDRVGQDDDVVLHPFVVALISGDQRLGDLLHHILLLDAFFLLDQV